MVFHVIAEAILQVLDDTVASNHHFGAELQRRGAHEEKLRSVLPCRYSADCGDGNVNGLPDRGYGFQSNGFHGSPGKTAVGGVSSNSWFRHKGLQVHSNNGSNSVDGRNGRCTVFHAAFGWMRDVGHIGGHLGDDGDLDGVRHPLGDHSGQFVILTNG